MVRGTDGEVRRVQEVAGPNLIHVRRDGLEGLNGFPIRICKEPVCLDGGDTNGRISESDLPLSHEEPLDNVLPKF